MISSDKQQTLAANDYALPIVNSVNCDEEGGINVLPIVNSIYCVEED